MKVRSSLASSPLLWALVVLAIAFPGALLALEGVRAVDAPASLMLVGLALLAECLPVEIERRGIHITFSLPYIAALTLASGSSAAMIANVLVVLVAAVVVEIARKDRRGHRLERSRRPSVPQLVWNASTVALCSAVAGLVLGTTHRWVVPPLGAAVVGSLIYVAVYGFLNFLVVTGYEMAFDNRRFGDNLVASLKLSVFGFVLYGLVSVSVAVLVHEGVLWVLPASLLPLVGLRAAVAHRATSYNHYYETMSALTLMLQRAHPYTHGHLQRVADYAEEVALRLGFSPGHARLIREASVLHDIGKIAIDEAILDKPCKLTDEEMEHVREHAQHGATILSQVRSFMPLVPWVKSHHERPDGTGYPERLVDVEIPVESKIISVVDAFDAMTLDVGGLSGRTYRDPMSVEDALEELRVCSGTQFDPAVVAVFADVVGGAVEA